MPVTTLHLKAPDWFRLRTVAYSHGWVDLPPFEWNEQSKRLRITTRAGSRVVLLDITQQGKGSLQLTVTSKGRLTDSMRFEVTTRSQEMLGLSKDFGEFYRIAGPEYEWARKLGSGPFLRGASVFEDAVKMLATTNCSWALTRLMINRLVDELGEKGPEKSRVFPRPKQWPRNRSTSTAK